jgi:hypothetical protein
VGESTRVTVGSGLNILSVVTGFEATSILIGNLALGASDKRIRELAEYVGRVVSMSITRDQDKKTASARVQYESAEVAAQSATEINGYKFGRRTLSAELLLFRPANSLGIMKNCLVKIDVPAPGKEFRAGYYTLEEAERVLVERNGSEYRGNVISAELYEGVPKLGPYCLKFTGIPPDTELEDIREWGVTATVLYYDPHYASFSSIMGGLRQLLRQSGEVVSIDIPNPLPVDGRTYILVRFASPAGAAACRANLNGGKPRIFGGKERIWVEHIHTLKYVVHHDVYKAILPELLNLKAYAKRSHVDIIFPRHGDSEPGPVTVKVTSALFDKLKKMKIPMDRIIRGEKLMDRGGVVWDRFFANSKGTAMVQHIAADTRTCIVPNAQRANITIYGSRVNSDMAKKALLEKYNFLKCTHLYSIPLTSNRLLSQILTHDLDSIRAEVSEDAVELDLPKRRLIIRGNDSVFKQVIKLLADGATRQSSNVSRVARVQCPICFSEAVDPVAFGCEHQTCKSCMVRYLTSAHDVRRFPLTCMGNDATCQRQIPLHLLKTLIAEDQLQTLVDVAFRLYIQARPNEYYSCPTIDCPQIYRATPGKVLQCPSCLVEICPSCHEEDHGGVECALSVDEDERLYREWKEKNNVKSCPKCDSDIEKASGCNHMKCSHCQIHICWVCSETFTNSTDVYGHMTVAHGSWA